MYAISEVVKSGKVKACQYKYTDIGTRYRGVIMDIRNNISDFKADIIWISKVIPNPGCKFQDVIKEFIEKMDEGTVLFMTQAGTFRNFIVEGSADEGLELISEDRKVLFEASFKNIIFNRRMGSSYGLSDVFIYNNFQAERFIEGNIGADKAIARIVDK